MKRPTGVRCGRTTARRFFAAAVFSGASLAASSVNAAAFTWTGTGGQNWATASNWNPSGPGPGATDTASFTDAGSLTLPGETTNVLNANRTIAGLSYSNTSGRHHTLDLATHALTINGNLHINTDVAANSVTTIRNGALIMNSPFGTLNVGRAASASAIGFADLTGLTSFNATLQDVHVGTSTAGTGTGTLSLPATTSIAAQRIWVGASNNSGSTIGTLHLGANSTLVANEFRVGKDNAAATVDITAGGSVQLGSATQRMALSVGVAVTETNSHYFGTLDLTGSALTAFLGDVTVGQRNGIGGGLETGTFVAGNSGTIQIGAPTALANFIVGRRLTGGNGSAVGLVDFSGLTSLDAHLNTFVVGMGSGGDTSARGTVKLAANNSINADTIVVGSQGNNLNTITLGRGINTILANQITVGQDFSSGVISAPAGSTVNLGSPSKRTSISLGVGVTETNSTYTGTLDFANATLVAYLNAVTIGSKNPRPGSQVGLFNISASADNRIEANSIFLGGPQATGTLNLGGGQMFAGSITRGEGTANFNWTGGRLSVNTFGAPATPFNLANTGTGTLAPGSPTVPVGITTVHGTYTQSAAAALAIDIAGASPSASNDLLAVSGAASLAGTLSLDLLNDFVPSLNQNFLIATYASRTGTFSFVDPPRLPAGAAFRLDYTSSPTQLFVQIVAPTDQNWISSASTATFGTAGNWNPAVAPTTTSNLSIGNPSATPRTVTVGASTTVHRIALQGQTSPLTLLVPAGIQLGVSNGIFIGPGATLAGGGRILGDIVVAGGGILSSGPSPTTLSLDGNLTLSPGGTLNVPAGSSIDFFGPVTSSGTITGAGAKVFKSGQSSLGALETTGSTTVDSGASVIASHIRESALTIAGKVIIAPNGTPTGTSDLGALIIAGSNNAWTGVLDLTDNDLVVRSTAAGSNAALATLSNQVRSGLNEAGGAFWTGNGITSSAAATTQDGTLTALGVIPNNFAAAGLPAGPIYGAFSGRAVGENDILIKYTYFGDADLSGVVDGTDYFLIDQAFSAGMLNGGWLNGDFNYSGQVDGTDYFLIDHAFSAQGVALGLQASAVPEPTLAGLCTIGAGLLAVRRRRRPTVL